MRRARQPGNAVAVNRLRAQPQPQTSVHPDGKRPNALAGAAHFSLDLDEMQDRYRAEPADEQAISPELDVHRQWAGAVLERVMARLKAEHSRAGKPDRFDALKPYLLDESEPGCLPDDRLRAGIDGSNQ